MKIRAVTIGFTPDVPLRPRSLIEAGQFAKRVRSECELLGLEIQTVRLATPPFPSYLFDCSDIEILRFAKDLESCSREQGFDYCSLGPIGRSEDKSQRFFPVLPQLVAETSSLFVSAFLFGAEGKFQEETALEIVRSIRGIAQGTAGGFGNLRFAALVNCPPHIPFFPAAYHEGQSSFAFALQSADIVRAVCCAAQSWDRVGENLRIELERQLMPLQRIGERLERLGFLFRGIDLSPAPGPDSESSIAYALEDLSGSRFGEPGTLAAAGFITSILKQTSLRTCGYCGLMLPVLEDVGLAERNNQGLIRVSNLLAYSAVCGDWP